MKRVYDANEFGEMVGVQGRAIRLMCRQGRLKSEFDGRKWVIPEKELLRVMKSGGWKKFLIDHPK